MATASNYRELEAKMRAYRSKVKAGTREAMRKAGHEIAESAKQHLAHNHSIDTGNLFFSIRSEGVEQDKNGLTVRVIADAESPEGTQYAEFVEFGTGTKNEHGDGRQTPWHYQDRDGKWHTTTGQPAKPFIRPAFAEHLGELRKDIANSVRIDGGRLKK